MKYLQVKHWDKFQHYKDRSPPWIKLHRELLRDYDFISLDDDSKLQLMLIWLLASQLENKIPNDPEYIKTQIGIKGKLNLKPLIEKGFLFDSNPQAQSKQLDIVETEAETETEADKETEAETERVTPKKSDEIELKDCVGFYNSLADRKGLPKVQKLTETRKKHLRARLKDCGGLEGWKAALHILENSSFCLGYNDRGWRADFDFLIRESSFTKLMEGKYDDRKRDTRKQQLKEWVGS